MFDLIHVLEFLKRVDDVHIQLEVWDERRAK